VESSGHIPSGAKARGKTGVFDALWLYRVYAASIAVEAFGALPELSLERT